MSALLLPELAREMAASNRRVADSVEAESHRLEELRGAMEQAEPLRKRALRSAREAWSCALNRKADPRAVWQNAWEIIEDGLDGEKARDLLADIQNLIDAWFRLAQTARLLWRIAASAGAVPDTHRRRPTRVRSGLDGSSVMSRDAQRRRGLEEESQRWLQPYRATEYHVVPVDRRRLADCRLGGQARRVRRCLRQAHGQGSLACAR